MQRRMQGIYTVLVKLLRWRDLELGAWLAVVFGFSFFVAFRTVTVCIVTLYHFHLPGGLPNSTTHRFIGQ